MTEPALPTARNPWGWIALGLLFCFLAFNANSRPSSDKPEARIERYTSQLQQALSFYEAGDSPMASLVSGTEPDESLRKLESALEPKRRTETIEAGFWAVVRRQLGQPVSAADLRPLMRDKDYRVLGEALGPGPWTRAKATPLIATLDKRGAASRLAADQLRREVGLPVSKRSMAAWKVLVVGVGVLGLGMLSLVAWVEFLVLGSTGALRPLGPATEVPDGNAADGLAGRAAALLVAFVGLQLVAGVAAAQGLDSRAATVLIYLGMIVVAVPLALRGWPTMAGVGLSTKNLGRNILLGLWAFLLELPVTMVIALLCATLLRNLPQPEHPASTALMNAPDLWTVLATFFGGSIAAPYWEETMFRGLLFPALRQVAKKPWIAALVSSFMFASIHPQGPVLWAALASVAMFSCALAQTTRSLVPSITMHFAHNTALLLLTLLMSR